MNDQMAAAGYRYRALWRAAGLATLQAIDPTRVASSAVAATRLLASEMRCDAFNAYAAASEAVTWCARKALDDIVLRDRSPEQVGLGLSIYSDGKICVALALTYLRMALRELVAHFERLDRAAAAT